MVTSKNLIAISCLWQSYDQWRGPQEYRLIDSINKFINKARPNADIMWCNDHMNEIHPDHAVQEQDLKFYDTLSIVEKYDDIFVCGWHGERCCAMKGWGTQTISFKGVRTGLITDLTVWWDHPPDENALRISARWADLVTSVDVLRTIS